jgi:hypothetical protein
MAQKEDTKEKKEEVGEWVVARFNATNEKGILERIKARLPEEPPPTKYHHDFDVLHKIENGPATPDTKELIEKTSHNIVRCGIRVFRIMKDLEEAATPLSQLSIDGAAKKLGIYKGPEGPEKDCPISSGGDVLRSILENDPKQKLRIILGQLKMKKRDVRGTKRGQPPDMPLHILTWYLSEHLICLTGSPNNKLIPGFFFEQGISQTEKKIERTRENWGGQILHSFYDLYRAAYKASVRIVADLSPLDRCPGDGVKTVDNATKERDSSVFPTWHDFMPKSKE